MADICKNWSEWLKSTRFSYMDEQQMAQTLGWLAAVRDAVLENADIKPTDTVIDVGTGTGLLAFGALEKIAESGKVIFSDKFEDCLVECKNLAKTMQILPSYEFLVSGCEEIKLDNNSVDKALMRSVLVHVMDKQQAINELFRILRPEGIFSAFEPVIRSNTRYYELISPDKISDYEDFKTAESQFMSSDSDPLTNFDQDSLAKNLEVAGFEDATLDVQVAESKYIVQPNTVQSWFNAPPSPGSATMKQKFLLHFEEPKVTNYIKEVELDLTGKEITVKANTVFIKAIKH